MSHWLSYFVWFYLKITPPQWGILVTRPFVLSFQWLGCFFLVGRGLVLVKIMFINWLLPRPFGGHQEQIHSSSPCQYASGGILSSTIFSLSTGMASSGKHKSGFAMRKAALPLSVSISLKRNSSRRYFFPPWKGRVGEGLARVREAIPKKRGRRKDMKSCWPGKRKKEAQRIYNKNGLLI